MQKIFFTLAGMLFIWQVQSCTAHNKVENQKEMNAQTADSLDWVIDELIIKWENNKAYTTEVIEAMPEKHFDFVPAEGMKSFKEQATHIVSTLHWQMEAVGFDKLPEFKEDSKEEIIASYETLFDYLITELKSMKGEQLKESVKVFYGDSSKRRLLNLMDNHVAHHRGQLIVYLRLKEIEVPRYRGW